MINTWRLKMGAAGLTALATLAGSGFVATHLKNPAAALQPPVAHSPTPAAETGQLHLDPSVRSASLSPITSTYVS